MRRFVSISLPLALLLACALTVTAQEKQATPPAAAEHTSASAAAALSNKDVLDMLKAGLSAEVITAKIKHSNTKFDTSVAALQELKAAGASESVMLAVVEAEARAAEASKGAGAATAAAAPSAPTGPMAADAARATVYVFRHKNFGTRNMQPSVYVDGDEVARMDDGKYFAIRLAPGKHTVEVNKGHSGAEIDMKAGEEYYFRIDLAPGFWKARGKIDFLQKEQGALEIKKMKPLEEKWIKDRDRVVASAEAAQAN